MLKFYLLLTVALPLAQAGRLLLTNDDGWDDPNIRALFDVLDAETNHELILCAPELGHVEPTDGSAPPEEVPEDQWSSPDDDTETLFDDDLSDADTLFEEEPRVPGNVWSSLNNPQLADRHRQHWPWGYNVSDLRLNHVPFDPQSAVRLARSDLEPVLYKPDSRRPNSQHSDLVLFGPKVLSRGNENDPDRDLGVVDYFQYDYASVITFATINTMADPSREHSSKIFADLAKIIVQQVTKHKTPYLPSVSHLRVTFPHVTQERCNDVSQFKFILTSDKAKDEHWHNRAWCNQKSLPFETDVVKRKDGCYVAISLISGQYVGSRYRVVDKWRIIRKLKSILKCLPDH